MTAASVTAPPRALALLPILALAWGATWPLMKLGVTEIPVLSFRALTGFVAGSALLALAGLVHGGIRPLKREWRGVVICAPISVTGWFYLSALSVTLLPAGRAALLAYTMPLWAFLIGVLFLGEPILKRRLIGLAAGVGAILLMAWDALGQAVGAAEFPWGVLVITGAAMVWSAGSTLQKEMRFESPVMVIAAWQLLIGAAPLALLGLALEPRDWIGSVGWEPLAALVGVGLVSQALGMWTWFTILTMTSVAVASLAILCVPLVGIGLAAWLLGETIGWVEIVGFALIAVGMATVTPLEKLFGRRRPPGV
ncbi:MAG: DMT family transporter [Nitratireductor sp.]